MFRPNYDDFDPADFEETLTCAECGGVMHRDQVYHLLWVCWECGDEFWEGDS